MATSGTVGRTAISTDKLLDHAWRRAGLQASSQTTEQVEAAKESLFMLLVHLANRGLNLWCVNSSFIPVVTGQVKCDLPAGTLSVLNVLHSSPQEITATQVDTATSATLTFDSSSPVTLYALDLGTLPTGDVTVEYSTDNLTWVTLEVLDYTELALGYNWITIDPSITAAYFRASVLVGTLDAALTVASATRELTVSPVNRDQYSQYPNKEFQSARPTDYFFEKSLTPTLSLWPVPDTSTSFLTVWSHRQVQDVGSLSQELAIPTRWLDSITTQLSFRVAMETPGVDPNRLALLKGLADEFVITSEMDETDRAPINLAPSIGCYTA